MKTEVKQQLLQKVITDFIELQMTNSEYGYKLQRLNDNISLVERIIQLSSIYEINIDTDFIQNIIEKMNDVNLNNCKTCKCCK